MMFKLVTSHRSNDAHKLEASNAAPALADKSEA